MYVPFFALWRESTLPYTFLQALATGNLSKPMKSSGGTPVG